MITNTSSTSLCGRFSYVEGGRPLEQLLREVESPSLELFQTHPDLFLWPCLRRGVELYDLQRPSPALSIP